MTAPLSGSVSAGWSLESHRPLRCTLCRCWPRACRSCPPGARQAGLGLALAWAGNLDQGEQATAALRGLGSPVAELYDPSPNVALQSALDSGAPHGRHFYWKVAPPSRWLPEQAIEVLMERVASITSPFSQIGGSAMGRAVSRINPEATAIGEREVGFDVGRRP